MTPIFIQTQTTVIDVAKVTHIDIGKTAATVHFTGGTTKKLSLDEATELLDAVAGLARAGQLVVCRAKEAA